MTVSNRSRLHHLKIAVMVHNWVLNDKVFKISAKKNLVTFSILQCLFSLTKTIIKQNGCMENVFEVSVKKNIVLNFQFKNVFFN